MHRLKIAFLLTLTVAMILFSCASDEEKKLAHFEKGKAYFEKGDYKAAIIEFKNATQIDPKYKEVYSHLGEAYIKTGDLRGAFRAYAILAELDPNNTEAQLKLSQFFMLFYVPYFFTVGFLVARRHSEDNSVGILSSLLAILRDPLSTLPIAAIVVGAALSVLEIPQGRALGVTHILHQAAGGHDRAGHLLAAKTAEVARAELFIQLALGGIDFVPPRRLAANSVFRRRVLQKLVQDIVF